LPITYYFLKSIDFSSYNSGSAQASLNRNFIYPILVRVPEPNEQRMIVSVLGTLDDKIELNRRMNQTLEAMAQSLFKFWFVDATQAALPKGWRFGSLAELMEIRGGTQPPASGFLSEPREGYIRLVQIRDYESESHLTFIPDTPKLRKCKRDDVMIARYGASVARICWGLDGAYNVALVKAAPAKPFYREYLRSYLKSHDFQERLIGMSNRSVQAGFNKSDIASFQIPIAPDEVFEAYQNIAWLLRSQILHNRDESRTLAALRDVLLPKLLSGELRVPVK